MYVRTHPEIRELLVILGKNSESDVVTECCEGQEYRNLTVCYYDVGQKNEFSSEIRDCVRTEKTAECFQEIMKDDLPDYHTEEENTAVLADDPTDRELIDSIIQIHPAYLVCRIREDRMEAFTIWETGRKAIDHFYLYSERQETDNNRSEKIDIRKGKLIIENKSDKKTENGSRNETLVWDRNPESDIELSVIFPVYNVAAYLPKCLESIGEWRADYVEYLFVSDGSPDNSAEIIREYAEKDPRIKLLEKENGGCASARQYGMERAKGRYIGFIDPDDYIDPTMFLKLLSRAMTGSYEIAYSGYRELYEETGRTQDVDDVLGFPYCQGTTDAHEINKLIAFRRIAIWRGIYLRSMIDKYKIHFHTDLRRFDDLPFKVETFAVTKSVVCVPEYLYYYRMSRPGQDVSADDERLYVHFPIFQYLDEFINKRKDREQIEYLQLVKLQTHEWALKKLKPEYIKAYTEQAREDLLSNMNGKESRQAVKRYTTRKTKVYHFAILHKMPRLIKMLNERGSSGDRKTGKQIQELNRIAYRTEQEKAYQPN